MKASVLISKMFKVISDAKLNELMKIEDICLIDVREVDEFVSKHLVNAINIPLSNFKEDFKKKDIAINSELYVMCRSGQRSQTACQLLKEMGYHHCHNIGGIIHYEKHLIIKD